MVVSLWQDPIQKQLTHNKHGIIGRSLFLHPKDGCTLQAAGM